MTNYLAEFLRILDELGQKNPHISDEELFAEIAKVEGFQDYLNEHADEIRQIMTITHDRQNN